MFGKMSWKVGSCGMMAWIVSGLLALAQSTITSGTLTTERDGNGNYFYKVTSSPNAVTTFYSSDISPAAKGQAQLPTWAKDKASVTVTIQNGIVTDIAKVTATS